MSSRCARSTATLVATLFGGFAMTAQAQDAPRPRLPLTLLAEPLALCRLEPSAPLPAWTAGARRFLTVSRTPDELSITADASTVPAGLPCERGYRAFQVQGPLPLDLVGILASMAEPLARARISIFAISTYDTDYVLVKGTDLDAAIATLEGAGHRITRAAP
jgi:hypothetical protein